jgi:hypothetical protein
MNDKTKPCDFQGWYNDGPCNEPAQHEVVWYLWPFDGMEFDDDGNVVPKWVWLCEKHYKDLQQFHRTYAPTHDGRDEDGCTSVVPVGISIRDVTKGY